LSVRQLTAAATSRWLPPLVLLTSSHAGSTHPRFPAFSRFSTTFAEKMSENRDQLSAKLNADSREVRWFTADPPCFLRSVSTASAFGRKFVFFMVRVS